jgi:hypothetical protein
MFIMYLRNNFDGRKYSNVESRNILYYGPNRDLKIMRRFNPNQYLYDVQDFILDVLIYILLIFGTSYYSNICINSTICMNSNVRMNSNIRMYSKLIIIEYCT